MHGAGGGAGYSVSRGVTSGCGGVRRRRACLRISCSASELPRRFAVKTTTCGGRDGGTGATSAARVRAVETVVLELAPQRRAGDAERVRGPRVVPPVALERLDDVRPLDLGEILLDGERRCRPQAGAARDVRREVVGRDGVTAGENRRVLDGVLSSSRTFPGQAYDRSRALASAVTRMTRPRRSAASTRKCSTSSGMSSRRSRSGGSLTCTTLSR